MSVTKIVTRSLAVGMAMVSGREAATQVVLRASDGPTAWGGRLVTGDLDGDRDIDILQQVSNGVGILLNDGHARFVDESRTRLPFGGGGTRGGPLTISGPFDLGDFDRDGDLDVFFLSYDLQTLTHRLWVNDGRGFYQDRTDLVSQPGLVGNPRWADVDNDGFLDVLLASRSGGVVLLYKPSTGRFEPHPQTSFVAEGIIRVADIEGDGDLDALSFNWDPSTLLGTCTLARNRGNGVFDDVTFIQLNTGTGYPMPYFVDVDHDGDPDVFVAHYCEAKQFNFPNQLFINDGHGFFTDESHRIPQPRTWNSSFWVMSHDFDDDGDVDLVLFDQHRCGPPYPQAYFLANDSLGTFTDVSTDHLSSLLTPDQKSPVAADFDRDGDVDILIGGGDACPWYVIPRRWWNINQHLHAPDEAARGQAFTLELWGRPGEIAYLALAAADGTVRVPGLGLFQLDPATLVPWPTALPLYPASSNRANGTQTVDLTMPSQRWLVGRSLYFQALLTGPNPRFTNAPAVIVR